jgi:2-aminoethylphosphonate-pyruvate transaminase
VDFLISTSNKNIQGIPGFAFVISKKELLNQYKGNAGSLVLDLYDQETCMFSPNHRYA